MDGLRKAALTLAGLTAADRAWMLERVGESERARVAALLDELRALDLSLDAQTLHELVQPAPAEPAAAASPLETASAGAVFAALASEPDWLIAALLRARRWKWREEFLRLLGTERRAALQSALPSGIEPGPKALEALAAAIQKRLDERLEEAAPEPESPPRAARLRGALGRLLGRREMAWRT